jgi:hypothetical protein
VTLAGLRCHVRRGGPHDRHDLSASAGPLLSCRLTTGLRWGSAPVLTTRIRPRATVAVAVASVLVLPAPVMVSTAVLLGGLLTELALLRNRLSRAVALTRPDAAAAAALRGGTA